MKLEPTTEQKAIIEAAIKGDNLIVEAYAGAAKTQTCVMVAEKLNKPSLYIAFNKSIADEAANKFPNHVTCKTMHSIAYRDIVTPKMRKKLQGWLQVGDVEVPKTVYNEDNEISLQVIDLIKLYCQSDSKDLFSFLKSIDGIKDYVINITIDYWGRLIDEKSDVKISHDVYLKLFQLSNPALPFKTIFLDEAQDSSPVVLDIVLRQMQYGTQLIIVGDRFQCLVKGTLVDGKPIESYKEGDFIDTFCRGHKSKRKITKIYKKHINEKVIKLVTESGKTLISTLDHTHLIKELPTKHNYVNYLMYKEGFGYRIGTTQQFRQRCSAESANKVWVLNITDNKQDAYIFEQVTAFTYGIPTLVFKVRNNKERFTQEYYDTIFGSLDTEVNARRLLKDFNLLSHKPHYAPQAVRESNLTFTIRAMGETRTIDNPRHTYSIFFSEQQVQLL